MSPDFLYWLQVSALIFFNIFCFSGIILAISLWRTNLILRKRTLEIAANLENQLNSLTRKSYNLFEDITSFALNKIFKR